MFVSRRSSSSEQRWGRSTERVLALALACVLIVGRSFVFTAYEQAYFDSDQAIVGLMAKHLSEGRAFPLFFYGQSYMLAVEAWLAAPWFWIAPPTVATLRASLVLTNIAAAALMIVGLERWGGLRPLHALVASLFFVFPPPVTTRYLVDVQGGSIEPFLYVPLLWWVRTRPIWFGVLLAIGFLNREFTMYAVPVLLAADLWRGSLFRRENVRAWLLAMVAFVAVWDGIQTLKPYADLMGPGTRGSSLSRPGGSQIANLVGRIRVNPREFPDRMRAMIGEHLPRLLGGTVFDVGGVRQGRAWMAWPLALGFVAVVLRIGVLVWRSRRGRRPPSRDGVDAAPPPVRPEAAAFGWYLAGVGIVAAAAYVATRPITTGYFRYGLLPLLIPTGLTAILLRLEPRRGVRTAVVFAVLFWTALSAVDNARQLRGYLRGDQPNEMRVLADTLVARGVQVAASNYWRAYKLTFLTREQVKVASTDFIRIEEYQKLAAAQGGQLLEIRDNECPGGERVASWYLCRAGRR